jgi:NADPH:quinone reductase-like Zn-dependent oxidoreductase
VNAPLAHISSATRSPVGVTVMRAVQITPFGGPEVLDVVDLPDPSPRDGEQLYDVSSAGLNFAGTRHRLS